MSKSFALAALMALGLSGQTFAAVPGFVVYGVATTLVVPRDGEPKELPGIWVLDDEAEAPPAVRGFVTPEACECPAACGAPAAVVPKTLLEAMPDSGRPAEEDCGWSVREPRALFGGRLELAGEDYNGCGLNLYGFGSRSVDLVRRPKPLPKAATSGERWCDAESSPATAIWPPGVSECRAYRGSWIPADMDAEGYEESRAPEADAEPDACRECARESWDSELHFVRRGLLVTIRDDVQGTGMGLREVAYVTATPGRCPSAADPCGDASQFSTVPGVRVPDIPKALGKAPPDVVKGPDFWIASDGSHALIWTERKWALWLPRQDAPVLSGVASESFDHVIGIRYHRDIAPLLVGSCSVLCSEPSQCPEVEKADEDDEADTRSASELGNACFKALKEGELDDAEALCTRALSRSPAPRTLGAVHYNLGLIAEKRGDAATARKHYEASLKARPNETVELRLKKLGPH